MKEMARRDRQMLRELRAGSRARCCSAISAEAGQISDLTAQISALEGRADELHDVGLRELYQTKSKADPMAFFVGNEVYDHLEKVVDRFDDVANVMHGIVIEHV